MGKKFTRMRWVAALVVVGGLLSAPVAVAAPQADPQARVWESMARPTVPQVPGYQITGDNFGKGNYRAAIDERTGSLWVTNVSPMQRATESAILEVDPNTMRLKKRIQVRIPSAKGKHGAIAAQYDIAVPSTGNTVWTTAGLEDAVFVWDKTTGKLRKKIPNVHHAHGILFAEQLGLAMVSITKPGGVMFIDLDTLEPVGTAVIPRANPKVDELGAGMAVTESDASGVTVTVTSYYHNLAQFRVTRGADGRVRPKLRWVAHQGPEGHGNVVADTRRGLVYSTNLYKGTISVHNLRTGRYLREIFVGPGVSAIMLDPRRSRLYAGNYWGGYLAVIDQRDDSVRQLMTTGLLPNQLVPWKDSTFLVIDKSSTALAGGYTQNRGVDRIWKVRALR